MDDAELSPLERAERELPLRFYEKSYLRTMVPTALGGVALGYASLTLDVAWPVQSLTGLAAFTAGALLDRKISLNLQENIDNARTAGLEIPYAEANTLVVGNVDNTDELRAEFGAKNMKRLEVMFALSSAVNWGCAIPLTAVKGVCCLNNHRKNRRVRLAMEIAGVDSE